MNTSLDYCYDNEVVFGRLSKLYGERSPIVCAKMHVKSPTVAKFAETREEGFCDYPDLEERVRFWDSFTKERLAIHDDAVPSALLKEMDQGLYGGLLGGRVRFIFDPGTGYISSMVYPILDKLEKVDTLNLDTNCLWFRRYVDLIELFAENGKGKYGISHLIVINGLNFVFELIGATASYMAYLEKPELVKKAYEFALELNLLVHKTFFEKVPLVHGGTCSNYAQWLPGRLVSESLDPWHMARVEDFEKWGREPVENLFSEFDGGIIHIHGNGHHLFEAASTLKGLKAIFLHDDKDCPPYFPMLEEIRSKVGDMPLICPVDYTDFCDALKNKNLMGGVLYNVLNVPGIDEANRCMDMVRKTEC